MRWIWEKKEGDMEQTPTIAQFIGSMMLAVSALGGLGLAATWLVTRRQPCNPYGYGACACGCGTDCEDNGNG